MNGPEGIVPYLLLELARPPADIAQVLVRGEVVHAEQDLPHARAERRVLLTCQPLLFLFFKDATHDGARYPIDEDEPPELLNPLLDALVRARRGAGELRLVEDLVERLCCALCVVSRLVRHPLVCTGSWRLRFIRRRRKEL